MSRLLVPSLLASLFASVAAAQGVTYYSAQLEGAQEVPPVTTTGRGWSVVKLDPASGQCSVFLFCESLASAATAAHLHLGAVGASGGLVMPLSSTGANTYSATATLTAAQISAVQAAGTYVNVHTTANPAGEIRGQVVTPTSTRFTAVLSGLNEVTPNASTATGTLTAWLHEPENRLVYVVNSTGVANATAGHVHIGAIGASGSLAVNMSGSAGNYTGVSNRLTATQMTALLANGTYVQIHSSAFPSGEIRGQLIRDAGDFFLAQANGAQEVPPTGSTGLGSCRVELNAAGVATVSGSFAGLSGPAIASHIHIGAVGTYTGTVLPLTISGQTVSAVFTPTAAQLADLRAGNLCFNVHTPNFVNGEIRGQLLPATKATTYGEACLGSNNVRSMADTPSLPSIGSATSIDLYGGLPLSVAVLMFGFTRDSASGLPLPLELSAVGVGAPKCFVLADPALTMVQFTNGFGAASMPLSIPFASNLRGMTCYAQWMLFDSAANAGGLVTSSALSLPIQ